MDTILRARSVHFTVSYIQTRDVCVKDSNLGVSLRGQAYPLIRVDFVSVEFLLQIIPEFSEFGKIVSDLPIR